MIYIVKEGLFKIMKRSQKSVAVEEDFIQEILIAPLASKDSQAFRKNKFQAKHEHNVLSTVGKGNMLGEEDVTNDRAYTSSVKCVSARAVLLCVNKDEFMKLRFQ